MKTLVTLVLCLGAVGFLLAADNGPKSSPATKPAKTFASVETKDLHNAHRLSDKLLSGAAPENEQAFKDLRALGVKTIISVDGAKPDVETAKKYGMRYVHLPIGYDGVEKEEGERIAKALSELPAPIYLHCHHGKHRSAAAVAVGCVLSGSLKPEQAESVLKTFGTGANYVGLWKSARDAQPMDPKDLAALKVDYVEQAKIAAIAERMVEVDKTWEHIKLIEKAGWKTPADHPALDPAHEALLLQEHMRESARTDDAKSRPADYMKQLADAEKAAAALKDALSAKPVNTTAAAAAFKTAGASCTTCHKMYRD